MLIFGNITMDLDMYNNESIKDNSENLSPYVNINMEKYKNIDNNIITTANIIHNRYPTMDLTETRDLFMKCITPEQIKSHLLMYDLKYAQVIPTHMVMDEFITQARQELQKYQWKACGFYIEDKHWLVTREFTTYDSTVDSEGDIDDHQEEEDDHVIYIANTVPNGYSLDTDTNIFIELMTNRLNALASNIHVKSKKRATKNLTWIILKIEENNEN
jgi:hypothetical protein